MRKIITPLVGLLLTLAFSECKKTENNDDLQLSLLNENIISYSKNSNKDSINIIRYCLKNNSDKIYFINNLTEQKVFSKTAVYKNGVNLLVYDSKDNEVKYEVKRYGHESSNDDGCFDFLIENLHTNESRFGYDHHLKYFQRFDNDNVFFIHPNETIFFEYTINLNKPIDFDGTREGFVSLDPGEKYYCKLSIASDSSNYKKDLPREILKTIEENHAKVYNGYIESKSKVPIKVIE